MDERDRESERAQDDGPVKHVPHGLIALGNNLFWGQPCEKLLKSSVSWRELVHVPKTWPPSNGSRIDIEPTSWNRSIHREPWIPVRRWGCVWEWRMREWAVRKFFGKTVLHPCVHLGLVPATLARSSPSGCVRYQDYGSSTQRGRE
jgi:hypothetical protein